MILKSSEDWAQVTAGKAAALKRTSADRLDKWLRGGIFDLLYSWVCWFGSHPKVRRSRPPRFRAMLRGQSKVTIMQAMSE